MYSNSSVYQMNCLDCLVKYVGQTAIHLNLDSKNIFRLYETVDLTLCTQVIYRKWGMHMAA